MCTDTISKTTHAGHRVKKELMILVLALQYLKNCVHACVRELCNCLFETLFVAFFNSMEIQVVCSLKLLNSVVL